MQEDAGVELAGQEQADDARDEQHDLHRVGVLAAERLPARCLLRLGERVLPVLRAPGVGLGRGQARLERDALGGEGLVRVRACHAVEVAAAVAAPPPAPACACSDDDVIPRSSSTCGGTISGDASDRDCGHLLLQRQSRGHSGYSLTRLPLRWFPIRVGSRSTPREPPIRAIQPATAGRQPMRRGRVGEEPPARRTPAAGVATNPSLPLRQECRPIEAVPLLEPRPERTAGQSPPGRDRLRALRDADGRPDARDAGRSRRGETFPLAGDTGDVTAIDLWHCPWELRMVPLRATRAAPAPCAPRPSHRLRADGTVSTSDPGPAPVTSGRGLFGRGPSRAAATRPGTASETRAMPIRLLHRDRLKRRAMVSAVVVAEPVRCVECGICTYNCPLGHRRPAGMCARAAGRGQPLPDLRRVRGPLPARHPAVRGSSVFSAGSTSGED